jgi:hypothetical protein
MCSSSASHAHTLVLLIPVAAHPRSEKLPGKGHEGASTGDLEEATRTLENTHIQVRNECVTNVIHSTICIRMCNVIYSFDICIRMCNVSHSFDNLCTHVQRISFIRHLYTHVCVCVTYLIHSTICIRMCNVSHSFAIYCLRDFLFSLYTTSPPLSPLPSRRLLRKLIVWC